MRLKLRRYFFKIKPYLLIVMKNNKELNYNSILTNKSDKVIVTFHGWQGNKDSFLPLAKNPLFKNYNWFLLEGPYMVGNNSKRRTWSYEKEPNVFEYEEPKELIYNFFKTKIFNKYESKNVYIIGFSLGALVCYEFICSMKEPLGGIFPISGFIRKNINLNKGQKNTPIVIGHGLNDEIVLPEESIKAYELLKKQNANVHILSYNGGHRIPNVMINEIINRIKLDPQ